MSTHPSNHDPGTRPRRRWRWWHTLLVVVATPFVLFAVWLALVIVSISGGLDDLFAGDPPRAGDPEVVAARRAATQDLAPDAARLSADVIAPALGDGSASVGRGEVNPPCQEGQHNWKIDDDFDLACDLVRVEVVAAPHQSTFRLDMVALDAALHADGWVGGPVGMDRVLSDYWDPLGTSPEPGASPSLPNYPRGYSMDDLPSAGYTKTVDGRTATLAVRWAERDSLPTAVTYAQEWATFRNSDGRPATPAALIGAIPAGGYAVVVTESVEYFRG